MANGHGICHGGFIFTLADTAMAFAANQNGDVDVAIAAFEKAVQMSPSDDWAKQQIEELKASKAGGDKPQVPR